MQKLSVYFKNPSRALVGIIQATTRLWPDKPYLSAIYWARFHRRLRWEDPQTFNEKLNWIKLYDRRDLYTLLADKYEVKKYVSDKIGQEYVVENYGVYDCWDDIDFSKLPNQFVVKGTHDSGGAFICRDKISFDFEKTKRAVENNRQFDYYLHRREWPYKNIKPRLIIDEYLNDHTGNELRDYKWWCFNGVPTYMYLTIKGENIYENFYDMDFNPVDINHGFPRHQPEFEKPSQFELMKELATILSKDIPFVRVDFFQIDNRVFFGEFTFFDWSGLRPFADFKTDEALGNLIQLPK